MYFTPKHLGLALISLVIINQPALAETSAVEAAEAASPDTKPPSRWEASIEGGAVLTSGNTESSSFNAASGIKYTTDSWLTKAKFSALTSREDKKVSKEKYTGRLVFNKNLTQRWYLGWVGQQERDRFSGYYHQSTTAINLGFKALNNQNHKLNFESGPGYLIEKLRENELTETEFLRRFAANYSWQLNKGVSLEQEYIIESSSEKTLQHYEAGFRAQINSRLAAKISYKMKKDSKVPEDKAKKDTQTSLNLVYKI